MTVDFAIDTEDTRLEKSSEERAGLSLLEQLAAEAEKSCSNPMSPILFGHDKEQQKALVIRASCKQWNCPTCGARNTRKWIARAINGTRVLGGKWYFMTLTPNAEAKANGWSLENLRKGIPKLLKRMKRKFGDFEYLRTYEPFADMAWHSHFIINVEMEWSKHVDKKTGKITGHCQWLEDNAASCGMGWKTDYQEIESPAGTAFYIAKYCTKSMQYGDYWPKNLRRIQASQGFPLLPDLHEETDLHWTYVKNEKHMAELSFNALKSGSKLFTQGNGHTSVKGMVKYFRRIRNDTTQEKQRGIADARRSIASDRACKRVAKIRRRKEEIERQGQRKSTDKRHEREPKARYSDLFTRVKQSTAKDERILDHEDRIETDIGSQRRN